MGERKAGRRSAASKATQPKRDYNPPLHVPLSFEQLVKGIVQVQPEPKPEKPSGKPRQK